MRENFDIEERICIRCRRRSIQPPSPNFCSPCLHRFIEDLGGRLVRPLINITLPIGVIKELRHGANESVNRMITQWRQEAKPIGADLTADDLPSRIGYATNHWRHDEDHFQKLNERRVGIDPAVRFAFDMFVLGGTRRFWRRYLRRRFQFDVRRHRSFLKQPIQPNSNDEVVFAVACYRFANSEAEFVAGIDALLNCKDNWRGCRAAVTSAEAAMREAARLAPLMTCMMATGKEQPSSLSAPALVSLTGWANTKVKRFPSIEKGTPEEFVGSVRIGLAEYLASVKKNFDVPKDSDKTSRLVNVIANQLRRQQPLAEKLSELKSTTGVMEVDKEKEEILAAEEFSARELARMDLNSLRTRANLSLQETELHEYLCRFPDARTSDIADHLGVKPNTAGVVKRNWRRKLRRAAHLE